MAEEDNYSPRMYWHYARTQRVKAKFFSPVRAIPAILTFIAQFFWKHKAHTPLTEMWIAIGLIIAVYLGLFALESLWNFTVLTPPKIYGAQVEVIGELLTKNSLLENELKEPKVSPAEERKRRLVAEKLEGWSAEAKKVLTYIMDHGSVNSMMIDIEPGFSQTVVNEAVVEGITSGLVESIGPDLSINSELRSALDYILNSQSF